MDDKTLLELAVKELENIANAKLNVRDEFGADEFFDWARSRARFTLSAIAEQGEKK